jgi:hypothetical protein
VNDAEREFAPKVPSRAGRARREGRAQRCHIPRLASVMGETEQIELHVPGPYPDGANVRIDQ